MSGRASQGSVGNDGKMEGELIKQSKWLKAWRTRHCYLKDKTLYYAKDRSSEAHGRYLIQNATDIETADNETGKPGFTFKFNNYKGKTVYLTAPTIKERGDWVRALKKATSQP